MPHVTEEQAALDKSMGENPPDIEQGTPVQEVREYILPRERIRYHRFERAAATDPEKIYGHRS